MKNNAHKKKISAPFFELGPKSYLYGDDVLSLAIEAEKASAKYNIDVIFTSPLIDLRRIVEATEKLFIFAPHMDPIPVGRGLADTLPESIKAAGAHGIILNHCEKPLSLSVLNQTIIRAKQLDLITMVCADSIAEARAVACLQPDIIAAEQPELISSGKTSSTERVEETFKAIKSINDNVLILQAAGISSGKDVYNTILAGAHASGSSSGIIHSPNYADMIDEMVCAVRQAWDDSRKK